VQQQATWPQDGEHVVAHHDAETLVVYQAYRPEIGRWATQLGGPAFSVNRMSGSSRASYPPLTWRPAGLLVIDQFVECLHRG
jgi:hypothetical protein